MRMVKQCVEPAMLADGEGRAGDGEQRSMRQSEADQRFLRGILFTLILSAVMIGTTAVAVALH